MLVERAAELAALGAELRAAADGSGRAVFVAGEAGVGKTSVVSELVGSAVGWRVRRGASDRLESPTALAPLSDAFPELADVVEATGEAERRRLFRLLREALAEEPTIFLLEDLHWADEATLAFLRFLLRRLAGLGLLVLGTYRDDEVVPGSPLSVLLGDLAAAPNITRLPLRPLSAFGVAELVRRQASPVHASDLHRRTGGNPFYVTEVLATATDSVPATVRDAVLARAATVSDPARRVLEAASVVGSGGEAPLVLAASGEDEPALDECVVHGLLLADRDGGGLSFRHELAREAVEAGVPPSVRAQLHRAALAWLLERDEPDHRRLAQHAEAAGEGALVLAHAPAAARRAARHGAHRESAELLRKAVRHAAGLPPQERALLLDELSYQCYLTDQLDEALLHRREALALHEASESTAEVGRDQRWLSRLSWFAARGRDARRFASLAVQTLEPLGPSRELAMAYSNRSQVAMLAGERDDAIAWGRRAITMAREVHDVEVEAHALNNVGTSMILGSDVQAGTAHLDHSLDLSLGHDFEEHAARAYTNLFTASVGAREYDVAERNGRAGIAYTAEHDLDSWRRYMTAWLALLMAELGRYDEADEAAASVLAAPGVAPVARIPALVVKGLLLARRGRDGAAEVLAEAAALATGSDEGQRLLPVAVARAELAWLADEGAADAAATLAETLRTFDARLSQWERGDARWWLRVLGHPAADDPGPVAAPYAAMLAGDWAVAATRWSAKGTPWWTALALARSPTLDDGRTALGTLTRLGATATHAAVVRDRYRLQLPVPREPRASTRANAAGLTAREMEVLRLVADGLTNAQIAAALVLSERTVDHHVAAVLRKLDAPTRARAVATAARDGMLAGREATD